MVSVMARARVVSGLRSSAPLVPGGAEASRAHRPYSAQPPRESATSSASSRGALRWGGQQAGSKGDRPAKVRGREGRKEGGKETCLLACCSPDYDHPHPYWLPSPRSPC